MSTSAPIPGASTITLTAAAPVPPASFIGKVSHYVLAHEKFLIILLAAALAWGVSGKIQAVIAAHDQKQYDAATVAAKAQHDTDTLLAASNAKAAADYQALAKQVLADNSRLEKESAALRNALAQQQAADRTLPPVELARRIETLAKIPTGSVVPSPNDSFTATHDGAVGIAVTLEQVPALQGQLTNSEQEKINTQKQLVAETARVDGLNSEITGLKSAAVKDATVCDARVKVEKDKAAKAKRKWFVAGFVSGILVRGALKVFGGF